MPAQERVYDFNASINAEAAIVAATSTRQHTVRSARLRSSGAGVVVFKDGLAGTTIAQQYFAADTPYTLGAEVWGASGKRLTKGNALTATLAGATLTGEIVCTDEDDS